MALGFGKADSIRRGNRFKRSCCKKVAGANVFLL
jgi:hypothetical protein